MTRRIRTRKILWIKTATRFISWIPKAIRFMIRTQTVRRFISMLKMKTVTLFMRWSRTDRAVLSRKKKLYEMTTAILFIKQTRMGNRWKDPYLMKMAILLRSRYLNRLLTTRGIKSLIRMAILLWFPLTKKTPMASMY